MQKYCLEITWLDCIFFYNNSNFLSLPIKYSLHPVSRSFLFSICIHFKNENLKTSILKWKFKDGKKKCEQKMSEEDN